MHACVCVSVCAHVLVYICVEAIGQPLLLDYPPLFFQGRSFTGLELTEQLNW